MEFAQLVSTSVSSTTNSKGFLEAIWLRRHTLRPHERHGLGQMLYLTLVSHMEGLLAELIAHRLTWCMSALRDVGKDRQDQVSCARYAKELETLVRLVQEARVQVESAALRPLSERFRLIFGIKLKDVLGTELWQDLGALGDLRNILAHGRLISLQFRNDPENNVDFDGNKIHAVLKRLVHAKIIPDLSFPGYAWGSVHEALHTDEALLYFLDRCREMEAAIRKVVSVPPEKQLGVLVQLPHLEK